MATVLKRHCPALAPYRPASPTPSRSGSGQTCRPDPPFRLRHSDTFCHEFGVSSASAAPAALHSCRSS